MINTLARLGVLLLFIPLTFAAFWFTGSVIVDPPKGYLESGGTYTKGDIAANLFLGGLVVSCVCANILYFVLTVRLPGEKNLYTLWVDAKRKKIRNG